MTQVHIEILEEVQEIVHIQENETKQRTARKYKFIVVPKNMKKCDL